MARRPRPAPLLDWTPPPQGALSPLAGTSRINRLHSLVSRGVAETLRGRDRVRVAARMTEILGESVPKSTLDGYASEGREASRINVPRCMALMTSCEDHRLLATIAERLGYVVYPRQMQAHCEAGIAHGWLTEQGAAVRDALAALEGRSDA